MRSSCAPMFGFLMSYCFIQMIALVDILYRDGVCTLMIV
jgi:hypothetical protein